MSNPTHQNFVDKCVQLLSSTPSFIGKVLITGGKQKSLIDWYIVVYRNCEKEVLITLKHVLQQLVAR